VIELMEGTNSDKLDELSLDDFAGELRKLLGVPKRLTLYSIRDEMKEPYAEVREGFAAPSALEIFTMLSGETASTLDRGLIIPVRVVRIRQDDTILVRLDSGIEGTIAPEYRTDNTAGPYQKPRPGQTIQALVTELRLDTFEVELSTQETQITLGDLEHRRTRPDPTYYNHDAAKAERDSQAATQHRETGRQKRVIKHPNFHNINSGQAEEYLAHMQRGDCVIRPSSKEDHLAVTWKVHDGIYQHIGAFCRCSLV
jgi:transcription elongation factor SPT6